MAGITLLNSLAQLLSQQKGSTATPRQKVQYSSATCLDPECLTKLFFPSHEASVECPSCGQRHTVGDLPDRQVVDEKDSNISIELAQLRQSYKTGKKTSELIKVKGISNYQCKLLSPLLTAYGKDKSDNPKLLKDLGLGEVFDCAKLASRAFAIEESHLKVVGYGIDRSGSEKYLRDTLLKINKANAGVECLVPIHADGDGHCLVHAISRCLVGRELFWHALRTNLHNHLETNEKQYQEIFKDFISDEEWTDIIAESAPDFKPPDGQSLGLRNIHIFGLSNVLHRPIILLDSLSGMQSKGDYSGIFLPSLHSPEECRSNESLNSPIVIAWSGSGRNHFIPLVPVRGRSLPKLPPELQPKVWGQDESIFNKYVSVDSSGSVEMCGGKELGEKYQHKLVVCMEKLFLDKYGVVPSLVADVDQYVYRSAGFVSSSADMLIGYTHCAVQENRLFRCLICSALSCVPPEWLCKGGMLYNKTTEQFDLENNLSYSFPYDGVVASYDGEADKLVPVEVSCFWCMQVTRPVRGSGEVIYENGDRTDRISDGSRCGCGYMHYWDGNEYDNLPEKVPLSLAWGGRTKEISVHWFQYESDPSRNSNAYDVAHRVVNDNFPGEFGSERLVQQVVERILNVTATRGNMEQVTGHHPSTVKKVKGESPESPSAYNEEPTKIILTGEKSKTFHKEELMASETERKIRKRIEENAAVQQTKRKSSGSQQVQSASQKKVSDTAKPRTPPPSTKTTPLSPSDDSPSPTCKPAKKKIRVTTSLGQSVNLTLDPTVTFTELQAAIETELNIPPARQKLRCGFPPKELKPSADPNHPVQLSNGEKVSVDIIDIKQSPPISSSTAARVESLPEAAKVASMATSEMAPMQNTLTTLLQLLNEDNVDFWVVGQSQPLMFEKGGEYYQQVLDQYGEQITNGTHLQFKEFPNKVFAYNSAKESLELCLGRNHIPVGPLTPLQEKLAYTAAMMSAQPTAVHMPEDTPPPLEDGGTAGLSGVYGKVGGVKVKAFSGKGHTLSSATSAANPSGLFKREPTQDDRVTHSDTAIDADSLTVLQAKERELLQKVRTINRQLVNDEADNNGGLSPVTENVLLPLETDLLNLSSELKQIREKIKELVS